MLTNNLKNYYNQYMNPAGLVTQLFEFTFKSNRFTMLFNIEVNLQTSIEKRSLFFVKAHTQSTFDLPIEPNFYVPLYFSATKLKAFREFFEVPYNPDANLRLDPAQVLQQIDEALIPVNMNNAPRNVIASGYRVEYPNAIYFDSMTNWTLRNFLKPELKDMHRTPKNKAKIQKLLPDLYPKIKDLDITVNFTATAKDLKTEQAAIQWELSNNDIK